MKKQVIAMTIATALTANMFQMALAASAAEQTQSTAVLEAILAKSNISTESLAELKVAKAQIESLVKKLNQTQISNNSDMVLQGAEYFQIVLLTLNGYALASHVKEFHKPIVGTSLSLASAILDRWINYYKGKKVLTANDLGGMVAEEANKLLAINTNNQEVKDLNEKLQAFSDQLVLNNNALAAGISSFSGNMSNVTLIISAGALLLQIVAPKLYKETQVLAKEGEAIIAEATPLIKELNLVKQEISAGQKASTTARSTSHGSSTGSNILDAISAVSGVNANQSKALIASTQNRLGGALIRMSQTISNAEKSLGKQ